MHITDPTSTSCDFANPPPDCAHTPQRTVIAQVAGAIFGGPHSIGFFYIQATTALILVLAANTAFNGFPLLGAILARDKNLPGQLNTRGDRLVLQQRHPAAGGRRRRADLRSTRPTSPG